MRLRLLAVLAVPLLVAGCSVEDAGPLAVEASVAGSPSATAPSATAPSASVSPSAVSSLLPVPSPPAGPGPSSTARPAASRTPVASPALVGEGVDLPGGPVLFGEAFTPAARRLTAALGAPSTDTGTTGTNGAYGVCPREDLRVLEYAGGAVVVLFGTRQGETVQTFYGWQLREGAGAPPARALVGDTTRFDFGPGTTVAQLRAGAGDAVTVTSDELVGTSFTLVDQSRGLYGVLSAPGPDGVVQSVQGGEACGE